MSLGLQRPTTTRSTLFGQFVFVSQTAWIAYSNSLHAYLSLLILAMTIYIAVAILSSIQRVDEYLL